MESIEASQLKSGSITGLLLDVRTPAEFREFHVEGAVNVPLDQLDPAQIEKRAGGKGTPIFLLCRSGARAMNAGRMLEDAGFSQLFCVTGGSLACQNAGVKMNAGEKKVISLERQVRIVAGSVVLLGVVLGSAVSSTWYVLSGFVGAGLIFAGVTDWCGMAMILSRAPWNR